MKIYVYFKFESTNMLIADKLMQLLLITLVLMLFVCCFIDSLTQKTFGSSIINYPNLKICLHSTPGGVRVALCCASKKLEKTRKLVK